MCKHTDKNNYVYLGNPLFNWSAGQLEGRFPCNLSFEFGSKLEVGFKFSNVICATIRHLNSDNILLWNRGKGKQKDKSEKTQSLLT